jgi:hypothetical protein
MFRQTKKFIAVVMLLWLPYFSSSAMSAALSMQLMQLNFDEQPSSQASSVDRMYMDECPMQQTDDAQPSAEHGRCNLCHFVGTGYLPVSDIDVISEQASATKDLPLLIAFNSLNSAPLLPPPLPFATAG